MPAQIFGEPIRPERSDGPRRSGRGGATGGGWGPTLALLTIIVVPAVALFGLWRFASARDETSDPVPVASATPSGSTNSPGSTAPDQQADGPSARPVSEPLTTGLLSWRRLADPLARDISTSALRREVGEFAATLNDPSCTEVFVGDAAVGERNGTVPVMPASSHKVIIASVALDVLGADHRFTTSVRGTLDSTGAVNGDLFLVGGGDPLLTTDAFPMDNDPNPAFNVTSLDELADAVVDAGVTTVTGSIVGDGSRYDDEYFQSTWAQEDLVAEAGPLDALLVNDARTSDGQTVADDPVDGAAREFEALLAERGVKVVGGVGVGTAPANTPEVASVQSAALPGVIAEMLTNSDDNTAEMLLKEIAVADGTTPGTWPAGIEVMRSTLEGWGVPLQGVRLVDASGLSVDNRLTCDLMSGVLQRSGFESPIGAGMAVAGETGTLTGVLADTPVAGRMHAKTGSLYNEPFDRDPPSSKSLVGFLPTDAGDVITFSLMLNGPSVALDGEFLPVWESLADVLASYPAGPPADELAPRPAGGQS